MKPVMRSIFSAAGALAFVLSLESAAFAEGDPAKADALYKEAVELFKAGNVNAACVKLDESFTADPKTQTLFSLAKCRQREGRVATAWSQFNELVKRGEREGDAAKLAEYRSKVAELDPLVPRAILKLQALPDVTEVRLDGKPIGRSEWSTPLAIDPGSHTFHVSAQGNREGEKTVVVQERETVTVEIDLKGGDTGGAKPADTTASASSTSKGGDSSPTLGYILGGVGVVAVGIGTITGIVAINHKSTADDRFDRHDPAYRASDDAASTTALASTIAWGVGIAGLAAGAYLILTHDSKKAAALSRVQVGASSDRIVIGGRF